jgi:exopolyphosphatase/guanosine-5'-triphosphate,3'-diphosphate pyrophosphatase
VTTVGVIDIGSTSVKTLIASPSGPLDRSARVTRLGRGVERTGRLDDAAVADTLAAIVEFVALGRELGAERWAAVATSACRDAANRDAFFDQVEAVLGVRPTLLSGAEEGRLAFRAATSALSDDSALPSLVIDIGGGSTELMYGTTEPLVVTSLDVGAGRLLERELHRDPPRPEELTNAVGAASDALEEALREHPLLATATRVIGVGGTIRVAAAVEIGLPEYDAAAVHGFELTRTAAEDVFRTLVTESLADRVHNPGLPRDRAEVIIGGCCVLVAILRRLAAPSLTVSSAGVLDAIAAELLVESR